MSSEKISEYSVGDWVVHRQHGAGQIKGIQKMGISGDESRYYRIETPTSTVWVPIDDLTQDYFRPLATPEEVQEAIQILQRPPRKMDGHFKKRQSRIKEVMSRNSFLAIARIVRDLRGRQKRRKSLSRTERSALRHFTENLLIEWSLCRDKDVEDLRVRLNKLLQREPSNLAAAD